MTQNISHILNWLVSGDYRVKAQIKYDLKLLESRLCHYLDISGNQDGCLDKVKLLCDLLVLKYNDYLKLFNVDLKLTQYNLTSVAKNVSWQESVRVIFDLKKQLSRSLELRAKIDLLIEITSLYYKIQYIIESLIRGVSVNADLPDYSDALIRLFKKDSIASWLGAFVDFCNQQDLHSISFSEHFRRWDSRTQQSAIDFYSAQELIHLINAVFFYRLYPDKLFDDFIHPEKLVSICMRLECLHHLMETFQQQITTAAMQYGLKSEVDRLFHDNELPQGILVEVDVTIRTIIQSAIKQLKIRTIQDTEEQVTIDRLHELLRAYKFWFNPNRLIDAVMILQQRLVNDEVENERGLHLFHKQMVALFHHLKTTDCLDLYGYFSNNDSRYLLYTLLTIINEQPLDWLPPLSHDELCAIKKVYYALQSVMEALRVELKNRSISTNPYLYDLGKQKLYPGRRNRDAVFRIITIYGREQLATSDLLEQLFSDVEDIE